MQTWKQPLMGSRQHLDSPGQSQSYAFPFTPAPFAERPQRVVVFLLGSSFTQISGSGVTSTNGHFPGFSRKKKEKTRTIGNE